MQLGAHQPQGWTHDLAGRMHSSSLAAKGSDGPAPRTRRKMREYVRRAEEEQPLTMQPHCPRACPAPRGTASDNCVTQMARTMYMQAVMELRDIARDHGTAIPR